MKTRNVVLALVMLAFVGSLRSFGLTYEFFDSSNTTSMEYNVGFKIYVDGQQQFTGLNSLGNKNYKMYWDVDPIQMKTAYVGLNGFQDAPVSRNDALLLRHYDGGFGGTQQWITDWSYPYTASLTNVDFIDGSRVGDYTISPDLRFNMNFFNGESVDITGNANIKGTYQFNFGSEVHNIEFESDVLCGGIFAVGSHPTSAYFGDDNYPQNLSLYINKIGAWWDKNNINQKCFEAVIENHNIEVYLDSIGGTLIYNYYGPSDDFQYDSWNGTLVPEPTTLSFLLLGGLSMLRKYRRK